MKYETLVTRYKNLGYEPKGLDQELEIYSIIRWLFKKHDIYIGVWHNKHEYKTDSFELKRGFAYSSEWNTKETYCNHFGSTKMFDDPKDALFEGLRHSYKAIKFQLY